MLAFIGLFGLPQVAMKNIHSMNYNFITLALIFNYILVSFALMLLDCVIFCINKTLSNALPFRSHGLYHYTTGLLALHQVSNSAGEIKLLKWYVC